MTEPKKGMRSWAERHFIALSTVLLCLFLLAPYIIAHSFVTIPAGHGGALWLRFFGGTVLGGFYFGEGTKVIFPWDKVYIYDTRVQQRTEKFDVLTRDGLQITAEVTVRFRVRPDSLGSITAYAGPGFVDSLLIPSVAAVVRGEAAKQSIDDVYSVNRATLEERVLESIRQMVNRLIPQRLHEGNEIDIEDFRIRSITLPQTLQSSIENKLTQFQLSQQYKYILSREEQEKERKEIEARGIKAFQDIVSSGISENYLRWKGIDATLKLAESANAKIVIIGGKEGLPVILGPLDPGTPNPVPARPAAALPEPPPAAQAASSPAAGTSDANPSSTVRLPPTLHATQPPAEVPSTMPAGSGHR